ncbi:hypothetical protein ACF061_33720 [Streptomyces sp. NPDC015220]|uniref:hypothetical protein n=1 Tax=Streptomyces sp. NPDC015220 TaxID=3364947 RepID=UPI0036FAE7DE
MPDAASQPPTARGRHAPAAGPGVDVVDELAYRVDDSRIGFDDATTRGMVDDWLRGP